MKKILLSLFFIFLTINYSKADEIAVVDVNFIMQESVAGKYITSLIQKENQKISDDFKKKEKNLIDEEKKLISQKNVLDEKEFKDKAKKLTEKINLYKKEKKKILDNLSKKKTKGLSKLIQNLNEVLVNYSKENSIKLVIDKKYTIITKNDSEITDKILNLLNDKVKKIELN